MFQLFDNVWHNSILSIDIFYSLLKSIFKFSPEFNSELYFKKYSQIIHKSSWSFACFLNINNIALQKSVFKYFFYVNILSLNFTKVYEKLYILNAVPNFATFLNVAHNMELLLPCYKHFSTYTHYSNWYWFLHMKSK